MSKHYAANGKTITACGLTTNYNCHSNTEFQSNNTNPKCKKCLKVLAAADKLDVAALVVTSEYSHQDGVKVATCGNKPIQSANPQGAEDY